MSPEEHHAEALRWLAIAETAYANISHEGTLPVVGAAAIAQVHAALADYTPPVEIVPYLALRKSQRGPKPQGL
ncbi:hypothetical protein MED01_004259 [Micromonospora sp. MED01]|uniref:hypothetical protein n=1 Tax=Micromonospora alfalfae TaxID=2911212 RepID=UPI001EE92164|nr:hypothetical protein [Micromonospora alfalfae]MCG5460833.1 hypothetical protein [Micromonospora alfalfae]